MMEFMLRFRAGLAPRSYGGVLGAVLVIFFVLSAGGTQRLAPPPIKPDPDLTVIRVTVTGPANKSLPRLAREHLKISEDGVEQQIEYFMFDSEPPSVAIVWGIWNDSLSAEARLVPLTFLETLAQSAPLRAIGDRIADLSRRQFGDPRFEYFLVEGGISERSPATVAVAFSTEVKTLPRIYPKVRGSIDSVYVGLDVLKESAFSKKALVFIGDSVDEGPATDYYKQFAIRQGVPVYYILGGGDGAGLLQLQELADVSGGEGYIATAGGAIEAYAKEIAQGLNNQYVVGYRPRNAAKDGKWRRLGVRVNPPDGSPKLHARVKSGYYAPRPSEFKAR